MRISKIISLLLLMLAVGIFSTGVVHAAISVEGPFADTTTQGDWTKGYTAGGSCFYLLPMPPGIGEFNINTTEPSPYCAGGSLATGGKLVWDLFADTDKPIFAWYFDPTYDDLETRPVNGAHPADQWNPCKNQFYGATFDNGDEVNGIYEPFVSEVTVNYSGSFRIAYYFLEEFRNSCREQQYKLFVNGTQYASGIVSDFDTGKYAVFNIAGLEGTSTIRLEVTNTLGTPCIGEENYGNVHLSGIFIDKCDMAYKGCTPGYWKQEQHFDSWTNPPYWTDVKFSAVFSRSITVTTKNGSDKKIEVTDPTLLQALNAEGGCVNAIARHAVAALLNAANTNVNYAYSTAEIIAMVQSALDSGNCDTIEKAKDKLDFANNAGCPLN